MPKFMVILQAPPDTFTQMSPQVLETYRTWSNRFRESGKLIPGEKLIEEGGKLLRKERGKVSIVDGPYSEAKELVGGYFTVRAESYDEVVALLQDCPHLGFGSISIRRTDPMGCGGE
jgi:hypothetical protein